MLSQKKLFLFDIDGTLGVGDTLFEGSRELLQDIRDELPMIHWSDKSIRDTIDQFIIDNDRVPTASDFRKKGMPPHPVIRQKYKITLAEWLKRNYPVHKPTQEELKGKYTEEFIADYESIRPKTQEEFNRKRNKGTKGWQTVAAYHGVKSWRALINKLGLTSYSVKHRERTHMSIKVNVFSHYDFND